jgi:2-dehydro-3-deoxygalactonokinase
MRGEETQVVGALALRPELADACTFILPGTHSKWTRLAHGRVIDFATYMTGELYAVLRTHSVLGRLMGADADAPDPVAFEAGVRAARDGAALAHQLFAVRSLGLSGELAPQALPWYLSGLLIGHEVGAALAGRTGAGHDGAPLALVGESALCALYQHALRLCGGPAAVVLGNTAPAGLWQLALGAGLVPDPGLEPT